MSEWQKCLWLGLMGAAGTLSRYGLDVLMQRIVGNRFPWAILLVNVVGCFLFGVVWSLADGRGLLSYDLRFLLLVGFMGSLTTFSTFAFQTAEFLRTSRSDMAIANVAAQVILGVAAIFLGISAGRRF